MGRHDARQETERDAALMRILAAVALVIIVIVVYTLIARPFSRGGRAGSGQGGMVVADVVGMPASDSYVGVILEGDSSIDAVVRRHDLGGAMSTGGGTYVLDTGSRNADDVIRELLDDPQVHDAGRVFDDRASSAETTSP